MGTTTLFGAVCSVDHDDLVQQTILCQLFEKLWNAFGEVLDGEAG